MNGLRKLACYNPDIGYSQRAGVPKRFTVKVRISERKGNRRANKTCFGEHGGCLFTAPTRYESVGCDDGAFRVPKECCFTAFEYLNGLP